MLKQIEEDNFGIQLIEGKKTSEKSHLNEGEIEENFDNLQDFPAYPWTEQKDPLDEFIFENSTKIEIVGTIQTTKKEHTRAEETIISLQKNLEELNEEEKINSSPNFITSNNIPSKRNILQRKRKRSKENDGKIKDTVSYYDSECHSKDDATNQNTPIKKKKNLPELFQGSEQNWKKNYFDETTILFQSKKKLFLDKKSENPNRQDVIPEIIKKRKKVELL